LSLIDFSADHHPIGFNERKRKKFDERFSFRYQKLKKELEINIEKTKSNLKKIRGKKKYLRNKIRFEKKKEKLTNDIEGTNLLNNAINEIDNRLEDIDKQIYEQKAVSKRTKRRNQLKKLQLGFKEKVGDFFQTGLWLEDFAFLNRFQNSFLSIDQRYETGVGVIFNWYPINWLTKKGKVNKNKLEKLPFYKLEDDFAEHSTGLQMLKLIDSGQGEMVSDSLIQILDATDNKEKIKRFVKLYGDRSRDLPEKWIESLNNWVDDLFNLSPYKIEKISSEVVSLYSERDALAVKFTLEALKDKEVTIKKALKIIDHKNNLVKCYQSICDEKVSNKQLKFSKKEIETLQKNGFLYRNDNIKKHSKIRLAFLSGIYYELEQATLENNRITRIDTTMEGSLKLSNNTIDSTFNFGDAQPTAKLRYEFRPTIEFQPSDQISIKGNYYFKFPLLERNEIIPWVGKGKNLVLPDDFQDLNITVKYSPNEKTSIELIYHNFLDKAPRGKIIEIPEGNNMTPYFFGARDRNDFYKLQLNFKF